MSDLQYFRLEEFDSPDEPGSGRRMCGDFLFMLDEARDIAQVPFRITSGYRTQKHQDELTARGYKTSTTSAHLRGKAADIACTDSYDRFRIVAALLAVGFNRVGVHPRFIHVDNDEIKTPCRVWLYG